MTQEWTTSLREYEGILRFIVDNCLLNRGLEETIIREHEEHADEEGFDLDTCSDEVFSNSRFFVALNVLSRRMKRQNAG